jgi:hypothetical protein
MAFTAHNIRLPDGSFTLPERPLLAESPRMKATARVLRLVYKDAVHDKSIVDLGCLEGGYTVEFARMGMRSTGIEVRQSNYANCMLVKNKVQLYSAHARTRKSAGSMTRKLSVTWSQ